MGNSKLGLLFSNPGEFLKRVFPRIVDPLLIALSPSARRHFEVGPAVGWKSKRNAQIDYLKQFIGPEHYFLDLGCGTLRGGVPIIRFLQEGHYYGVEARAEVVEMAREELANERLGHKNPRLIHASDLSKITIGRKFDFIWAHSVLIHMTDEILEGCLHGVSAHLDESGQFYCNVNLGDQMDGSWKEFPIVFRTLEFYSEAAARHGLSCEEFGPWGGGQTVLRFQLSGAWKLGRTNSSIDA